MFFLGVVTATKTTEVKATVEVGGTEAHKDSMVVTRVTGEISTKTETGMATMIEITTGTTRIEEDIIQTTERGTEGGITRDRRGTEELF